MAEVTSLLLLEIVLLLVFAGFLAGSEAALTSISRVKIEELERLSGGAILRRVTQDLARYLNVALLVRKTCELSATVLLSVVLLKRFDGGPALFLTVVIMVVVSYVIVGVGPRTLGKQNPYFWARGGAVVTFYLASILTPITSLLIALGNAITPGKGFRQGPFANEAELRDLVDQAHERGLVESDEHEMIHSVFELGDTLVRELMVPRTDMVWIEKDKTLRQALSLALRSGFSRIPVVGEDVDNIIGIAYVKDLAKRVLDHHEAEQSERVEQLMRPATFVPENKIAAVLLKEMQRNQIHLAIVIDEYGGTAGIITIEDIIEEIVGEIEDEYDDGEEVFTWLSDDTARAQASLHVEDFARELDITVPEVEYHDVDTIGGLMAKKLGRVPIPGSTIFLSGWNITAERTIGRRRRISSVLVEREEPAGKEEHDKI